MVVVVVVVVFVALFLVVVAIVGDVFLVPLVLLVPLESCQRNRGNTKTPDPLINISQTFPSQRGTAKTRI